MKYLIADFQGFRLELFTSDFSGNQANHSCFFPLCLLSFCEVPNCLWKTSLLIIYKGQGFGAKAVQKFSVIRSYHVHHFYSQEQELVQNCFSAKSIALPGNPLLCWFSLQYQVFTAMAQVPVLARFRHLCYLR